MSVRRGKMPGLHPRTEEDRLTRMPSAPLRALLAGSIDYAGLFPPAALSLPAVCANYVSASTSAESWALGRLVVPASRLGEVAVLMPKANRPWRVAALIGDDLASDAAMVRRVNAEDSLVVDAVELRTPTIGAVEQAVRTFEPPCTLYAEIPISAHIDPLLDAISQAGVRAKMRTGGVTAEAFPTAQQVTHFFRCCNARAVAFKATAGLHHPLRGDYRLTYDADAVCGTMFGFFNVLLAAALARMIDDDAIIVSLLEERDPAALRFDADGIVWREHFMSTHDIAATRDTCAISFGSCSFCEPLDDLHHMGLL